MKPPILSVKEARSIDERATREYGIPSILLMENAARGLSDHIQILLKKFPRMTRILFFCGGGNNGGDGLAAARHLYKKQLNPTVYLLTDPKKLKGDAATNYVMATKLGVLVRSMDQLEEDKPSFYGSPIVFVDAMLGTGSEGEVKTPFKEVVQYMNTMKKFHNAKATIAAADIPTGLNGDTGPVSSEIVLADLTVTFGSLKKGLLLPDSRPFVGRLEFVDIGLPEKLLDQFSNS